MSGSAAPVRLGLALSNEAPIAETVALASQAEQLGLSEVWLPESSHGRGVFSVASAVAAATHQIKIGIGIVNPFWRHPSVIAMEAAALDEACGGRLMLGLGAALWTLRALGEADSRTQRPLTAMVEAIRVVRGMLRGEPGVDGQVFAVRSDARLDFARHRPDLPIYVGAVNSRMLRAAGAWADGVQLGAIVSPGYARWSWAQIARGALEAGRDPGELDLASNVLVSVDRDARAARDAVRNVLAYYVHRVESVVLSTSGTDPDDIERVRRSVLDNGVAAGAKLVTDEMIDTFAAAGTPAHVAARLQEYVRAGLHGVLAWHVIGPDRTRGLQLLANEVRQHVFPWSTAERLSATDSQRPYSVQQTSPRNAAIEVSRHPQVFGRVPRTGWGVWLHGVRPANELANLAAAAEGLGATAILVADEGTDRDLYVTLAALALRTRRVLLVGAVTNPFSRHPVATAAAFAALAELAPGRVVAGFGAGGSRVLGPMGLRPRRPFTALVECVDVVQALWRGQVVDHAGEFFLHSASLPWSIGPLPIAIAGRGPRVERFAAERADWILLAGRAVDRVALLVEQMRATGTSARGRAASIAWNPTAAWAEPMVAQIRAHFAYMAVDMPAAERVALGLDDDRTAQLKELVNARGPESAASLIPDAVLERYAVTGTRSQVVARLAELRERIRPEMFLFDADDYSVAFLEEAAAVALDAGAVTHNEEGHDDAVDSYRRA